MAEMVGDYASQVLLEEVDLELGEQVDLAFEAAGGGDLGEIYFLHL